MKRLLSLVLLLLPLALWAAKLDVVTDNSAGVSVSFSSGNSYEWEWYSSTNRLRSTNYNINSSTSQTTISISCPSSCTFSFDYAVSSESGYDKLTILLDNQTIVNAVSGSISNTYNGTLTSGSHSLVLKYVKDGSTQSGDDRAYLSNVRFMGNLITGTCSPNLTWTFNRSTGKLSITGTGYLGGFSEGGAPWYQYRTQITSLELSEGITSIGHLTFEECNISSVSIPASVNIIYDLAFNDCHNLQTVRFEDTSSRLSFYDPCTTCDDYSDPAFKGCPVKTLYVGRPLSLLEECGIGYALTSLTIGGYGSIHPEFYVSTLTNLSISSNSQYYSTSGYHIMNADGTTWYCLRPGAPSHCMIPSTVTEMIPIGVHRNVTSLYIPSSVTRVYYLSSSRFPNITSITVTSPNPPVYDNSYWEDVTLYVPVGAIPAYRNARGWQNFTNIEEISTVISGRNNKEDWSLNLGTGELTLSPVTDNNYIANTKWEDNYSMDVRTVRITDKMRVSSSFTKCNNLTDVYFEGSLEDWCEMQFDDGTSIQKTNPLVKAARFYINNVLVTNVVIPEGVTRLRDKVFYGYQGLQSVTFPSTMNLIGRYAFTESALTTVNWYAGDIDWQACGRDAFKGTPYFDALPYEDGVKYAGPIALDCQSGVERIVLKEGTLITADFIFKQSMTYLYLPSSIKSTWILSSDYNPTNDYAHDTPMGSLHVRCLYGCNYLNEVYIADSDEPLTLFDSKFSDGNGGGFFSRCPLQSIYMGRNIEVYPSYGRYGSHPEQSGPFYHFGSNSPRPRYITFGERVTTIDDLLFSFNNSDSYYPDAEITCKSTTPPVLNTTNSKLNSYHLIVPCGSIDAYQSTQYWSQLTSISEQDCPYTRSTTPDNYGTICLPKAVAHEDIEGGVFFKIVYAVTNTNDEVTGILMEEETEDLVAGKPYIFRATAEELILPYTGEAVAEPVATNGLVGNLFETPLEVPQGMYVLSNNQIRKLAGGTATAGQNRAYIDLTNVTKLNYVPTAAPNRVMLNVEGSSETTDLENIQSQDVQKIVRDGQILIIRDGKTYNVLGTTL